MTRWRAVDIRMFLLRRVAPQVTPRRDTFTPLLQEIKDTRVHDSRLVETHVMTAVYSRLRGTILETGSSERRDPSDSKRPARRNFLKSGAAFAGGFTLGLAPALGQTPASPP